MVPERGIRREPQNLSIPVSRFQSGGGLVNHTGGTYSHGGMLDSSTFPISELHLGNFPDSMKFQNWKVNFKTKLCAKSADPHLTMHWIKEAETAKSIIDELVTSRSIVVRNDFTDYDMLDAMIASALKRPRQAYSLPHKSKCRRAACSNIRPIPTRETNYLHDPRAVPCNWSL